MVKRYFVSYIGLATVVLVLTGTPGGLTSAQSKGPLEDRINRVIARPEFRHSIFGIEFYSLDTGKRIFTLNADKLFTPGSTTKLLTEGTALELLGSDYRFHTRVGRTGAISPDGTLTGDLVLIASGDPNLSGRIRQDQLDFENEDHTYAGDPHAKAVAGSPTAVISELAGQIAAHNIKQIT
ncbi:MAG TPA: D-alanyl-D-alanine carboxypeptidase, partial [Blastocatellia bacterium]